MPWSRLTRPCLLDWTEPLWGFMPSLQKLLLSGILVMTTRQVIQYGNNEDGHNTGLIASFNTKHVPDMKITGFSKQTSVFPTHNPRTLYYIRWLHLDITVLTRASLGGSKTDLRVDEGSRRYATRKIMLASCWLWIPRTMLANRAKGVQTTVRNGTSLSWGPPGWNAPPRDPHNYRTAKSLIH